MAIVMIVVISVGRMKKSWATYGFVRKTGLEENPTSIFFDFLFQRLLNFRH